MNSGIIAAWREVKLIVAGLSLLSFLMLILRRWKLALLSTGLLSWVFYFFRDPERVPVSMASDFVFSPADGRVSKIDIVDEPYFIHGKSQRITIFLSLFDVHVQRCPYPGTVNKLHYQPGGFMPAFLSHSDKNEANLIGLETTHGPLVIKQMTGILARRIVCWLKMGEHLRVGQRLGLIRFGSRVDLFVPLRAEILVYEGQQLYGGQTIVARWKE